MNQTALREDKTPRIGDYIKLGSYNGMKIKWRCVYTDATGSLMLSDKVLCFRQFDAPRPGSPRGSNNWETSSLRRWLNDTKSGFLSGFTAEERSLMASVTQKSLLNHTDFFSSRDIDGRSGFAYHIYNDIAENSMQNYDVAFACLVTDTVFLPDISQLQRIRTILGNYYLAQPTQKIQNSKHNTTAPITQPDTYPQAYPSGYTPAAYPQAYPSGYTPATIQSPNSASQAKHTPPCAYWLRTPYCGPSHPDCARFITPDGKVGADYCDSHFGLRPAFYWNG